MYPAELGLGCCSRNGEHAGSSQQGVQLIDIGEKNGDCCKRIENRAERVDRSLAHTTKKNQAYSATVFLKVLLEYEIR